MSVLYKERYLSPIQLHTHRHTLLTSPGESFTIYPSNAEFKRSLFHRYLFLYHLPFRHSAAQLLAARTLIFSPSLYLCLPHRRLCFHALIFMLCSVACESPSCHRLPSLPSLNSYFQQWGLIKKKKKPGWWQENNKLEGFGLVWEKIAVQVKVTCSREVKETLCSFWRRNSNSEF